MSAVVTGALATPVDHVTARYLVQDNDPVFDLGRLSASAARPIGEVLSAGYGAEPVWVRLRVDPGLSPGSRSERLLLRVRPGYVDEVLVFDPVSASWPTGITGDRHPLAWQAYPSTVFNVALASDPQPRDVWVRITSKTARTAHIQVVRERDSLQLDAQAMLWSGLYLGTLSLFAVWGMAQLFLKRDALTAAFVGFQLTSIGYGVCVLGYVRVLVETTGVSVLVDALTSVMVLAAVVTSLIFNTLLLREMHAPANGLRLMYLIVAFYPVLLVMQLAGYSMQVLELNMVVVLLAPVVMWLVALKSRGGIGGASSTDAPGERRIALAYFTASMLLTTLAALPGLGLIEGGTISLHIIMLHGVVTGFLMLGMLLYRIYRLLQQRELLSLEAAFNRQRAQQEKFFREDQERLLAMLAHELKTPLATLRMILGAVGLDARRHGVAERAVEDMNQVIDRCLQAGQLDGGVLRVVREPVEVGALLSKVVTSISDPARLDLSLPLQPLVVHSDPQLMEVVVRNLLDNALKYSPADSRVQVRLYADDTRSPAIGMEVRNTVGQAGKPSQDKVFSKYYRNPMAKRRTGSGLGLFLVRSLVAKLQGSVSYEDEGKQVCFRLSLPAVTEGGA